MTKINFKFSYQYENALGGTLSRYPKKELLWLEDYWQKNAKRYQKAIKEITGLSFKSGTIDCYLNSKASFSSPLSIRIMSRKEMEYDLEHELIHVFQMQNEPKILSKWSLFMDKYKKESPLTRNHIPVHALHFALYKKLYPKKKFTIHSTHKDYVRSWEVVKEVGYKNILKEIYK